MSATDKGIVRPATNKTISVTRKIHIRILRSARGLWQDFVVFMGILLLCMLDGHSGGGLLRRSWGSIRNSACATIALLLLGASVPHSVAAGAVVLLLTASGIGGSFIRTASTAGVAVGLGRWALGYQPIGW
jgi:hypothetical protein